MSVSAFLFFCWGVLGWVLLPVAVQFGSPPAFSRLVANSSIGQSVSPRASAYPIAGKAVSFTRTGTAIIPPLRPDEYTKVCTSNQHATYFLKNLKPEFYNLAIGGCDGVCKFVKKYGDIFPKQDLVMWDIGAGCYSDSGSDTVLGVALVKQFGCASNNRFYSFEPQAKVFLHTFQCIQRALFSSTSTNQYCLHLDQVAFSNTTRALQLSGSHNTASVAKHLGDMSEGARTTNTKGYTTSKENVMGFTVSDYAKLHNIGHIDLLKIDTEGHDFAVIEGSLEMLRAKTITVVIIEVSDKMNPDFWQASYGDRQAHKHGSAEGVKTPNVKSIQTYMEALGYYGFWAGIKKMVPLTNECWDDSMEICGDPHTHMQSGICWFDAIFVLNQGYGSTILRRMLKQWD